MRSISVWLLVLVVTGACSGKDDGAKPPEPRGAEAQIEAEKQLQVARAAADKAQADAKAAADRVDKLAKQLDDQQAKLDAAITAVANAKSQADIADAQLRLAELQKERGAAQAAVAAAKQAAEKAVRMKGVQISPECVQNPLAKGCS